ncbi:MAG: TIGR03936 family radical SAM-associated protein [Bacillota bacterium]
MRVRVRYTKGDTVRFLSHLDIARNLRMALAGAKWPVAMTQGYSPKMKVSFYAPLPVGTAGDEEYMDVVLDTKGIADFIRAKAQGALSGGNAGRHVRLAHVLTPLAQALSAALPKGIALKGLYIVPDSKSSFESQIRASLYRVETEEVTAEALSSAMAEFLAQAQVLSELRRPGQTKTVDLRKFVESIDVVPNSCPATFFMKIRHENGRTVRPQWVIDSLARFGMDVDTAEVIVDRIKLYLE